MASNNTNEDKHNNLWLENLPVCIKTFIKKAKKPATGKQEIFCLQNKHNILIQNAAKFE